MAKCIQEFSSGTGTGCVIKVTPKGYCLEVLEWDGYSWVVTYISDKFPTCAALLDSIIKHLDTSSDEGREIVDWAKRMKETF